MKGAPMNVYRLQNYTPPAQPSTPAAGGLQLPPQIQQWISAGASLLPPGLLPPGLTGSQTPTPAPDAQRFPPAMGPQGFPIVTMQPVTDANTANDILDTFGHASNFQQTTQNCMLPEFGVRIQPVNAPPADFLISLSCQNVQAYGIAWPYQQTGITPDSEKKFVSIFQHVFTGH
jgi:hypothetical protein